MKIFHCLGNYFPNHVGGTEIYVNALSQKLKEEGFDVSVVKPALNKTASDYIFNDVPVLEYCETSSPTAAMQMGLSAPDGLINFRNLLIREKPDAVHFHETAGSIGMTIYHVKAAADLGLTVLATFHLTGNICMSNSFLYKESHPCTGIISPQECSVCILHKKGLRFGTPEVLTWLGSNLQKALVVKGFRKALNYPLYVKKHKGDLALLNKYCSKVFVFSGWYKRLLIKNEFDEKKIVELPPSVTGDIRVKDWRKETLETGSVVRFVYIGRIASIKGLHVALAAFSRLKQKNWLFDIYGHNTDEDYLRLCKSLAAENPRINWLGPFKQADVLAMLPEYHALIFPSLVQETMGLCMLEALASKIPVIGSSIWAIEETIEQQKNGYIFRRGDDKDLQRIIEQILAEPAVLPYLATNIQRIDNMSASADLVGSTYLAIHSSQAPR